MGPSYPQGVHAVNRNVGIIDRILRVGAGLALIGLGLEGSNGPWGFLGVVPVVTSLIGSCPAYSLLGISTCAAADGHDRRGSP